MIAVDWRPGAPRGRGRWWIYWRRQDSGWSVDPVEVSPSLLHQHDDDARLLLKLTRGVAYDYDTTKWRIRAHAVMEVPDPPAGMNRGAA